MKLLIAQFRPTSLVQFLDLGTHSNCNLHGTSSWKITTFGLLGYSQERVRKKNQGRPCLLHCCCYITPYYTRSNLCLPQGRILRCSSLFHPLCRLPAFSLLALHNYLLTDTAVSVVCSTNQDSSLHPLFHKKAYHLAPQFL